MDYKNRSLRLVDAGLVLETTPDLLKPGEWSRLNNVKPISEGFLETRPGFDLNTNTGTGVPIHSIRRLNSGTLMAGSGGGVYRNGVLTDSGYSGGVLSMTPFRPQDAADVWMFVGDSNQMRKIAADGTAQKWGITAPTSACSASSGGAGNLNSTVTSGIAYEWRYTYVNTRTLAESNPSPAMSAGISLNNEKALVSVFASTDSQVGSIYLYRRGGSSAEFRRTKVVSNLTATVEDNNSDISIASAESLFEDNFVPFTREGTSGSLTELNLPYVWGPFAGIVFLATGDPQREGWVFWTNPGNPDAADITNAEEVTGPNEPLMNGWIYGAESYTASRENVYALMYGTSDLGLDLGTDVAFKPRLTPVGKGLAGRWAFCIGTLVYFLSKDGIYKTDCATPAKSITEAIKPIFLGKDVDPFKALDWTKADTFRMVYSGSEVHFFYTDTSSVLNHLVFDTLKERWRSDSSMETTFGMGYEDEDQSKVRLMLGGANGKVYEQSLTSTTDNGSLVTVTARAASDDFAIPNTMKEVGNIIVDANPNGNTITITPYINAEQTALPSTALTGSVRQKFPIAIADVYCYSFGVAFGWSGKASIYDVELLWRDDEEEITHWEFPPTSHQLTGWHHGRDLYICLRSTSEVTLTVDVLGGPTTYTDTYTLASTGGEKKRVYVQLEPRKGKLFHYKLDSSVRFRLYGEDCEINIKSWATSKSYQMISPFVQTEGGT